MSRNIGDNPILDWLDEAGLTWREPRGALTARYGVDTDNPYHWELVSLKVNPPPLPGMLWPFCFQAFEQFSPFMPPVTFSTHISVGDDAEANIQLACAHLGRRLGAKPIVDQYNTRRVEWRAGAASVILIIWPRNKQSGPPMDNPAHRRDTRLEPACSLTVQTGWRPPMLPQDREWLDGYTPLGPTRNWPLTHPRAALELTMFVEKHLEFMREPPADVARFRGSFGLSGGNESLIFCEDALYVVPLQQIQAFEVQRVLPAKGGGGSYLNVRCETGYARYPTKSLQIAQGACADDLNSISSQLAETTGKQLELGDYQYDA